MEYRTAFITGASGGIGEALARKLAADGVEVAIAARRQAELDRIATEIREEGGSARVVPLDVASPGDVERAMKDADDAMGGIDLVVANAGIGVSGWAGAMKFEDVASTIAINVTGATATLVSLLPRMVERGRGHLVGVSSLAQYRGLPKSSVYSASKAFLSNFLEGIRVDVRSAGVAVTDVRPGFVRTPMTAPNAFPMPFLVEAHEAAEIIWRGIRRGDAIVEFPWQLAAAIRTASVLPASVWDRAITMARGRR